jgi:hypothetical protein
MLSRAWRAGVGLQCRAMGGSVSCCFCMCENVCVLLCTYARARRASQAAFRGFRTRLHRTVRNQAAAVIQRWYRIYFYERRRFVIRIQRRVRKLRMFKQLSLLKRFGLFWRHRRHRRARQVGWWGAAIRCHGCAGKRLGCMHACVCLCVCVWGGGVEVGSHPPCGVPVLLPTVSHAAPYPRGTVPPPTCTNLPSTPSVLAPIPLQIQCAARIWLTRRRVRERRLGLFLFWTTALLVCNTLTGIQWTLFQWWQHRTVLKVCACAIQVRALGGGRLAWGPHGPGVCAALHHQPSLFHCA